MGKYHSSKRKIALLFFIVPVLAVAPIHVYGKIAPIEQAQENLENISEEEKNILNDLFTIVQEMEAVEQEEARLSGETEALQKQIARMEAEIKEKQKDYDTKLHILEQVLIYYQRGGPATYLEILLSADSLSAFLKGINVIKDISRNVGELLDALEKEKLVLQEKKGLLDEKAVQLEDKKAELKESLHNKELLKQEQEEYLASLQEERTSYEEQLNNLTVMWEDCRALFSDIVAEITRIIGEGYFSAADLNLEFGFVTMQGTLEEETFNNIIRENSDLPETVFHFNEGKVVIEVPEKYLVLDGNFVIAGDSAVQYEVDSGTFYDLPLDKEAIEELFKNGPLLIDFAAIAGDMTIVDFKLQQVESREKSLVFEIKLEW